MRSILTSFQLAFQNIRANLFHTFLSVLGIVIGVAALVGILSLIDGLEKFARDQITATTSLNAVGINTETHKTVNGLRVAKDTFAILDYPRFQQLQKAVQPLGRAILSTDWVTPIAATPDVTAADTGGMATVLRAIVGHQVPDSQLVAGRAFNDTEQQGQAVAIVNQRLAYLLYADSTAAVLGKTLVVEQKTWQVVGLTRDGKAPGEDTPPVLQVPIAALSESALRQHPPDCFLEATGVEDVPALKTRTEAWLKEHFGAQHSDFKVFTNEFRVEQAAQGFLVFRIVMGLIVGISVLVGGIGVMNVLLISVTERTPEVGLRKAVGAKRRDILRLFLTESVAVSVFGSALGLIFGILGTMLVTAIIRAVTDVPFEAAYTLDTFVVVTVVAVLIGMIFGTYPAVKAARLDPVEAIRRE
jgi:putative ABC transport system permease protein